MAFSDSDYIPLRYFGCMNLIIGATQAVQRGTIEVIWYGNDPNLRRSFSQILTFDGDCTVE